MSAIVELPKPVAPPSPGHVSIAAECRACLDTGITLPPNYELGACAVCHTATQTRAGSMLWDRFVYREVANKSLVPMTIAIGRVLTHYRSEMPCPREALEGYFDLSERMVKKRIEELRKEWLLPIGSRKDEPHGYWFISTAAEFLEWHRRYRAQAMTEITTGYAVMRANFPELAGQGKFDFAGLVAAELEEALRGQQ